ncbi:MAG TPA: hypothetical protein VFY09_05220 [Flavobacteriaceae bacterium]|nr:hypothetical protein [Flavobacteriaceae bacterium]MDH3381351.1 hypothetical protein [Flavobacteriaceae bacterium]HEX5743281.1 hypothetical protein [Flavobacteriaceae bacterium]
METKLIYLSDLEFNLRVWKRELKFHKEELKKFEKQLEDIASRNLGIDAMAPLEGFQNKIIKEREVIDNIMQRIRIKKRMVKRADLHEELDGRLQRDQEPLRDEMKTYVKLHYELKEALMDFLVRWIK